MKVGSFTERMDDGENNHKFETKVGSVAWPEPFLLGVSGESVHLLANNIFM